MISIEFVGLLVLLAIVFTYLACVLWYGKKCTCGNQDMIFKLAETENRNRQLENELEKSKAETTAAIWESRYLNSRLQFFINEPEGVKK